MKNKIPHGNNGSEPKRREVIDRLSYIHNLLAAGKYVSARQLAAELNVTVRTVRSDLSKMRDHRDLPIVYDPVKGGYHYAEPVKWLPTMPHVSQEELFALAVAKKAVEQYPGVRLAAPMESAYRKLSWRIGAADLDRLEGLRGSVSFRPYAPEEADPAVLETVTNALKDQHLLHFEYRNGGTATFLSRLVEPYHLTCSDNQWYVIGYDRVRKGCRTFALGRMSQPVIGPETFTKPKDFDPSKYLRGSMTVMNGTGDYAVVIELDALATDWARGREWHASQEMTVLPGGSRLSFRLNNLEEIQRLVLSWGTHATVIAPECLRDRIAEVGRQFVERYRREEKNEQN